jgi:dihydrofolate synthase/folylpolyglutamate synthase
MTYSEACSWLFEQFPSYQIIGAEAYKPNLINTERLCVIYGNPESRLRFIHVAGTNGKGSVCSLLASTFQEAGYKTGLFTSPHLLDFRERIRVNGVMISEETVIDFVVKLKAKELNFSPSFFEITWALALREFEIQGCEICIIETGLGGRLDSTNIIQPELSIITSIGIDHTQFLGNTFGEIASEKAGIIKMKVPVVIGETLIETKPVFIRKAKATKSPIIWAEKSDYIKPDSFLGEYQNINYKTFRSAIATMQDQGWEINDTAIELGVRNLTLNTGFCGRMQQISSTPLVYLDVAHNIAGIQKTLETINKINTGKLYIIYATSNDKDISEILKLFPLTANYIFTQFEGKRAALATDIKQKADELGLISNINSSPQSALEKTKLIVNENDTILILGSFFLVNQFLD